MDLVSIIITTYKGKNSIVDCVKSALFQTFNNFEVIVVDDNGKDTIEQKQTQKLLEEFFKDERFSYIVHEKNMNGSAARNTGIKNSKGNYLAFLDDDDILFKNSIELRYKKLSKMPLEYGIVFASFVQYIGSKKDFECIYNFKNNILEDYLLEKIHSPSSVIMVKKAVIEDIGLWDEDFKRHQDWEFITRVLTKYRACSVSVISVKRIVTWRNNTKNPELFKEQRLFFLKKMDSIIKNLDILIQKEIIYVHFMDIGKNYLKHKKVIEALKWAIKSGKPINALKEYIIGIIKYIKKK